MNDNFEIVRSILRRHLDNTVGYLGSDIASIIDNTDVEDHEPDGVVMAIMSAMMEYSKTIKYPLVEKALLEADMLTHDLYSDPRLSDRADKLHTLIHDASYELLHGASPND